MSYCVETVNVVGEGATAMQVLVPVRAGGGEYCIWRKLPAPGSRKSSGDTLLLALMPLHPAPSARTLAQVANCAVFQSNLTSIDYRLMHAVGNS
jgi:hypothetical protein